MQKELFVPGRLCVCGEHSDWAGGHRRQNSEIEKGYAIVAPTNQGIYARVDKIEKKILRLRTTLSNEWTEMEFDAQKILEIAEEGGIFSYIAGVVHEIISSYFEKIDCGIEIDNYRTDLPVKKGLSSSAAICVLIAKAFNEIYNLGFTTRRIMEIAYLGEIATPSRCGKMDQACAYGKPVLMCFDGDKVKVEEIEVKKEFYFLIIDLNRKKDTVKILHDLNKGFPWAGDNRDFEKQSFLGKINKILVGKMKKILENGEAQEAGLLMKMMQEFFDEYLIQFSPDELEAPTLHEVLNMNEIQQFIYGGKGIGSGGDGSAQLICKSKEDREEAKKILEMKGFSCMELDIKPSPN